jgi:hypothetical protein
MLVGENIREAVSPLAANTEWLWVLARALAIA